MKKDVLGSLGIDTATRSVLAQGITVFTVPGSEAVAIWHKVSRIAMELGAWPVILGEPEQAKRLASTLKMRSLLKRPKQIMKKTKKKPVAITRKMMESAHKMMHARLESSVELPEEFKEKLRELLKEPIGELKSTEGKKLPKKLKNWCLKASAVNGQVDSVQSRGQPLTECLIAVVKCDAMDIPMKLAFGGFNHCPQREEHVERLRDWNKRFGTVPICVMELYVPRPPTTAEGAWKVALEMAEYCDDIVSQGTQTVEELVRQTWKSNYWFFWWD